MGNGRSLARTNRAIKQVKSDMGIGNKSIYQARPGEIREGINRYVKKQNAGNVQSSQSNPTYAKDVRIANQKSAKELSRAQKKNAVKAPSVKTSGKGIYTRAVVENDKKTGKAPKKK